MPHYSWHVADDKGRRVASGTAPDSAAAGREVQLYAMQYARHGEVSWAIKHGRKTLLKGRMTLNSISVEAGKAEPVRAPDPKLTRVDAVALWHAVQAFGDCVRAMRTMPDMAEQLPAEEQRHADARRALRKVQAQVRAATKAKA